MLSALLPLVQTAKLLDARESSGMYYVNYAVNKQGEPGRVISSVVALVRGGGWASLLLALVHILHAQFWELLLRWCPERLVSCTAHL